jgi:hypothetical protein
MIFLTLFNDIWLTIWPYFWLPTTKLMYIIPNLKASVQWIKVLISSKIILQIMLFWSRFFIFDLFNQWCLTFYLVIFSSQLIDFFMAFFFHFVVGSCVSTSSCRSSGRFAGICGTFPRKSNKLSWEGVLATSALNTAATDA